MASGLRPVRIAFGAALLVLALVPAVASASKGKGTGVVSSGCSISPGLVALDQNWTLSAWGLPTGSAVNMIITYPDGTTLTTPVTVASEGTYTLMQSSAEALPAEQTGTYRYHFVGNVKWPAGTFNQSYAACSVQVS